MNQTPFKVNDKVWVCGLTLAGDQKKSRGIIKGFTETHEAIVGYVNIHGAPTGNYSVVDVLDLQHRQQLES